MTGFELALWLLVFSAFMFGYIVGTDYNEHKEIFDKARGAIAKARGNNGNTSNRL